MSTILPVSTVIDSFRNALYNYDQAALAKSFESCFAANTKIQLCYPFETLANAKDLVSDIYPQLVRAIPDLERRDTIVMQGATEHGDYWVGCCGYYTGAFKQAWLDIPPTGRQVSLRFHEFFRIVDGRIAEMQAIWDIPELMMQAGVWPLSPSIGREWHVPAPASQNGLYRAKRDTAMSQASHQLVGQMCRDLGNYASGGVEAMRLAQHWHPNSSWYGPSCIGTGRGIEGFRKCHQIPFLKALPNRVGNADAGHLFADNDYVGFTAWPGMHMTVSNDGWLGIAPGNQEITMRSLDFWRCENGLIRENWVLIDMLHVYAQLNIDVFARMRELLPCYHIASE